MTVVQAYGLKILEEKFPFSLVNRNGKEHWVKTEALELSVRPNDEEDWADWLLEYGDNTRA